MSTTVKNKSLELLIKNLISIKILVKNFGHDCTYYSVYSENSANIKLRPQQINPMTNAVA